MKMNVSPYSLLLSRPYDRNKSGYNTFSRSMLAETKHLHQKDLKGHFGCVNALEFSNKGGEYIISGGDDRRVLLWKYEEALSGRPPQTFKARHFSNIFCLAFDNENRRVLSGGNDEQVLVHDVETGKIVDVYRYDEAVYCLSVDPINSNVFASASDDGEVAIYDMRAPVTEDPFVLVKSDAAMHAVMYNPVEPRLLTTANSRQGLCLWDIRQPKCCLLRYGGRLCKQSAMSVRISQDGRRLIALRRRLPPVLYNIDSPHPVAQFDHPGYYNSCAMKTCCFAGDKDQFLLSGSDDNNVYMWKIPEQPVDTPWQTGAHAVLQGHRSLVNQVRYNAHHQCIISSGVEKIIKVWSPFPLPDATPEREPRQMYSHEEYINLVLGSGELMGQDILSQNTEEDQRMFAFFDSLVQRELEGGWSSEEESADDTKEDETFYTRFVASSMSSNGSDGDSDARSEVYSPFTRIFANVLANQETHTFPSLQELSEAAENREDRDRAANGTNNGASSSARSRQGTEDCPLVNGNNTAANDVNRPSTSSASDSRPVPVIEVEEIPPERRIGASSAQSDAANSPPTTVTALILSKRKEYLAGIRKQEERQRQRQRMRLRRCHIRLGWATSSSSSSSSDNEGSSSGSSNAEYQEAVTDTLHRLQNQRRQHANLERMGRLRFLRSQVEEADEEAILSQEANVPSTVAAVEEDAEVVVDGVIGLPEHSSSPFTVLHDALSVAGNTGTTVTHCGVHTDNVPTSSAHNTTRTTERETEPVSDTRLTTVSNGTTDCPSKCDKTQINHSKPKPNQDESNGNVNSERGDKTDHELTNGDHGDGPSTSDNPVPSTSNEQTNDNTWQHFKRFKKNVEKARRIYRKRKHPEDDQ